MCPRAVSSPLLCSSDYANLAALEIGHAKTSNDFLRKGTKKRDGDIHMLIRLIEMRETVDTRSWHERFDVDVENKLERTWKPWDVGASLPILETIFPFSPSGMPLRACILEIMWEIAQWPRSTTHTLMFAFEAFLGLLSSAARYQTTCPGVSNRHLFNEIILSLSINTG